MEKLPNLKLTSELTELAGTAVLGAVPLLGGTLGAGFAYAMSLSFNRRQQRWFEDIAQARTNLEEQLAGLTFGQLAADDGFAETFIAATRAAACTHHQVKLDALRNTVVIAADIGARPDEELRLRMIRLVDEMVPLHIPGEVTAPMDDDYVMTRAWAAAMEAAGFGGSNLVPASVRGRTPPASTSLARSGSTRLAAPTQGLRYVR